MPSVAVEDYLKEIYELQTEQGDCPVSTTALAKKMGVRAASVTGMFKKLAACDPKLIEYRPYHGARLTPAGERIALSVLRKHLLLERYLEQALGFPPDQVHGEADRLEHAISQRMGERIEAILEETEQDSSGRDIPPPAAHPGDDDSLPSDSS